MAPKITIILHPPENGEFYSSDDLISGTILLDLNKSLSIKQIKVNLKGFTETTTKMDSEYAFPQNGMLGPALENRSYHNLVRDEYRAFPPDNVWDALEGSSKPFKIKPGHYEYMFQFDKIPSRPVCLKNHTKKTICFVPKSQSFMPPSFNNQWRELNKIDNLDLYFYSFGKVIYMVEVEIEMGKPKNWFKPFDKIFRETSLIEFIPEPKPFPNDDINSRAGINYNGIIDFISKNKTTRSLTSPASETEDGITAYAPNGPSEKELLNGLENLDLNALSYEIEETEENPMKRYKCKYPIGLPDGVSMMWIEVRSREIETVYRKEFLFREGCGKFDNIFLIIKGKGELSDFSNISLKPTRLQLNLLETVSYLSQGIGNENFSSLKLMEIENISKSEKPLFNTNELRFISNSNHDIMECEIKLKDNPILKRLMFNEEDYRHRGNKLYSFKTCVITRLFSYQLLIDWNINGQLRQTEVVIPVQVFVQQRPHSADEALPRYIEPPSYDTPPS
ncbi:Arrestin-related trafficking adapter 10 [Nakaseomyces bracarensis]|uniref:Arrestin-related trafficking adapter 10 n=1 Tax=Nakaseomyces bracarensis TaxID=273131 RepID=A0ABR4NSQ7_9SACH